jgi:hypothetical protein
MSKFSLFKSFLFFILITVFKFSSTSNIHILGHKNDKPIVHIDKQYPNEKQKQLILDKLKIYYSCFLHVLNYQGQKY